MDHSRSPQPASPFFANLCILLIVLINGFSLIGWLTKFLILARIEEVYIPVAPSTALSFCLLAAGLYVNLHHSGNHQTSLFTKLAALLTIGFALLILGQYFKILNTDIEQLLVKNPSLFENVPIGRMSPLTAIGLLFSSSSLLTLQYSPKSSSSTFIHNILPVIPTLTGFIVLVGYAYGAPLLYGSSSVPVAFPTGIVMLLYGLGIYAASDSRRWPLNHLLGDNLRAVLLRAFLPVVLILFFSWDLIQASLLELDKKQKPLLSSIFTLVSLIVITSLIILIARKKGADIDRMGQEIKLMLDESEKSRVALLGILEDEQAAQSALQIERNFATQLMEAMGQGLTVTDSDGHFIFVNPAYANLLGYSAQELIGKQPGDVTSADDHETLREAHALRLQRKTNTYETKLIRSDGKIIPVLITGVPRIQDNQVTGTIATITDLREQKQAEERLAEQVSELRRWQTATLGREGRLLELKHEVNELLNRQGQPPRYPSAEQDQPSSTDQPDPEP